MISDGQFDGLRIMLVEDDMLIAMDLEDVLSDLGAVVLGPYSKVNDALEAARRERIDGAILDLDLRGEMSFPVIDALRRRNIPAIVCSGYVELPQLRETLRGIPTIGKPCVHTKLIALMKATFLPRPIGANDDRPRIFSMEGRS